MSSIVPDDRGWPVLLADTPNSGVAVQRKTGSRGGNQEHDSRSGKFTGDREGDQRGRSQAQANIDPVEYRLMRDAVRDAARQNEGMSPEDLEVFLRKRVRDFDKVDFQAFASQVREQRLEDLADILADQTQARIRGGKAKIKVTAPRGYVKRVFTGLSDDEVVGLALRMSRRGFSDEQLRANVISRISDESRREALALRIPEEAERYR